MNKLKPAATSAIEQTVMAKIQSGRLKMHRRSYYLWLIMVSSAVVLLLGLVATYFISVLTLWGRVQTAIGPAYGAQRNLESLLAAFPWWALALGLLALVLLIYIVRKLGRLYRVRLIYLIPAILIVIGLIGYGASYSVLPDALHGPHFSCPSSDPACRVTTHGQGHGRNMK